MTDWDPVTHKVGAASMTCAFIEASGYSGSLCLLRPNYIEVSEGEAFGYISLDQARVLAFQHARYNQDIYGRYTDRELVIIE